VTKGDTVLAILITSVVFGGLGYGLGYKDFTKPEPIPIQRQATGVASWYDYELNGHDTYSKRFATCASRDYPKGTTLTIINIKNNKQVTCKVNDYIEHVGRNVDLSSYAFKKIADLKEGVIPIKIMERLSK